MRIAFLGLGRLGLPVAAVLSQHHAVTGYDPDPSTARRLKDGHDWEVGLAELLGNIRLVETPDEATFDADVTVICVPTPHEPLLDGTWETWERAPFDTSFVRTAMRGVETPIVVMSTLLPGDCESLGYPTYNPMFPAMGTTISDVTDPEFILAAGDFDVMDIWAPIVGYDVPYFRVDHETAELAKMAYNTAIGMKIGLANTVGWLAEEVGADGRKVMEILRSSTRRITSPAYMLPGLGDGGACHPRDQIALSWLAQTHDVYDLFGELITQRYAHSRWIIEKALNAHKKTKYPVAILGAEYKADSTLTDGSPALLMSHQSGWPIIDELPTEPHVIIIGVPHSWYLYWDFSAHAVIDPWSLLTASDKDG